MKKISRFINAMIFDSQDSMNDYLRKHPGADHSKHKVVKTDVDLFNITRDNAEDILKHPLASKVRDSNGYTPLHHLVINGYKKAINHPDLTKLKDKHGTNLLGVLASHGVKDILNHPEAGQKCDKEKNTPLHYYAASVHDPDLLKHPLAHSVSNGKYTPADWYHQKWNKKYI